MPRETHILAHQLQVGINAYETARQTLSNLLTLVHNPDVTNPAMAERIAANVRYYRDVAKNAASDLRALRRKISR